MSSTDIADVYVKTLKSCAFNWDYFQNQFSKSKSILHKLKEFNRLEFLSFRKKFFVQQIVIAPFHSYCSYLISFRREWYIKVLKRMAYLFQITVAMLFDSSCMRRAKPFLALSSTENVTDLLPRFKSTNTCWCAGVTNATPSYKTGFM